ncbi:MAG: RNA polymerase sigma factor RpoD [Isosphaeraceae bacterium]
MMRSSWHHVELEGFTKLDSEVTRVLDSGEERELLRALDECKQKLAEGFASFRGTKLPGASEDPQTLKQFMATFHAGDAPSEARLGAIFHRYRELRGKLALANMRLIAHVAKRFRDRGVSYSDLLQEGFCGLLEAIDRFDMSRETKLATYATWWIRQSMQGVVASGAYPVRLSPRHLRQLARSQDELEPGHSPAASSARAAGEPSPEMIHRIQTATRPTVSLDLSFEASSPFNLLQTMSDPEGDRTDEIDMEEAITHLLEVLRPREREVLSLRFGLGNKQKLSLSQVGKVLSVSKERIRQIQDRALEKLRAAAHENLGKELLLTGV